jgi:hypothetical protein
MVDLCEQDGQEQEQSMKTVPSVQTKAKQRYQKTIQNIAVKV